MDCIFCKIASGDMPCYKVYEDDKFLVFLDIRPLNLGHVQVVPKKHYRWVWDMPNIGEFYELVSKIANAMKKAFHTDFVVSLVSGEEVAHAHTWLIPRHDGDGHGGAIILKNIKSFSEREMQDAATKIKNEL